MTRKQLCIIVAIIALCIEGGIIFYASVNLTNIKVDFLNPPEESKNLSYTLLYPSDSVLFPIPPINSTAYVYLNITLNYVGEIAERQPVNLTVSGFMTQPMANKTDSVFVEFTGAVPYDNGNSIYGPWFSGVILQKGEVDQEGHVLLKNDSTTIVWNTQGYQNPVVVIRDYIGEEYSQEYTDFPVYVIGFSEFQQIKSNRINTALSVAALGLSLLLSINLFLKLLELRDKKVSTQTQGATSVKSELNGKNLNMKENDDDWKKRLESLIDKVDKECKRKRLYKEWLAVLIWICGVSFLIILSLMLFNLQDMFFKILAELPQDIESAKFMSEQVSSLSAFSISGIAVVFAILALFLGLPRTTNKELAKWYYRELSKNCEDIDKVYLKALIKMKCKNFNIPLKQLYEENIRINSDLFSEERLLKSLYYDGN